MRSLALLFFPLALISALAAVSTLSEPRNLQARTIQATGGQASEHPPLELTFGVYTSDRASTMYRKFAPLLDELNLTVSDQLGREVDIALRIAKTYDEGLRQLVEGEVDFVRFGPASYVLARDEQPEIQLLVMELKRCRKRSRGSIVVRTDSDVRTLQDLRGRSFAFGDPNSTIGRYLSQAELVDAGLRAADLGSIAFLDRHDRVAAAVAAGDFAAGAVKNGTLAKLDGEPLRVLASFDNVTKPWIARAGLEPEVVAALSHALLALDDGEALGALGVSGFSATSDSEYTPIRAAIRRAAEFEAECD